MLFVYCCHAASLFCSFLFHTVPVPPFNFHHTSYAICHRCCCVYTAHCYNRFARQSKSSSSSSPDEESLPSNFCRIATFRFAAAPSSATLPPTSGARVKLPAFLCCAASLSSSTRCRSSNCSTCARVASSSAACQTVHGGVFALLFSFHTQPNMCIEQPTPPFSSHTPFSFSHTLPTPLPSILTLSPKHLPTHPTPILTPVACHLPLLLPAP